VFDEAIAAPADPLLRQVTIEAIPCDHCHAVFGVGFTDRLWLCAACRGRYLTALGLEAYNL
jgi:hypothetical protein